MNQSNTRHLYSFLTSLPLIVFTLQALAGSFMPQYLRIILFVLLSGGWGAYLLYIWMMPTEVPEWAMSRTTRKVLFLGSDFEPNFSTLIYAVMLTSFALYGVFRLATDQRPD